MVSLFSWLLGSAPQGPPVFPDDEVLPMHPFDDTATLRDYTLIWTFRYDEVLDADMLGDSLSQLFQMEGWRKLGGRLRLRVSTRPNNFEASSDMHSRMGKPRFTSPVSSLQNGHLFILQRSIMTSPWPNTQRHLNFQPPQQSPLRFQVRGILPAWPWVLARLELSRTTSRRMCRSFLCTW